MSSKENINISPESGDKKIKGEENFEKKEKDKFAKKEDVDVIKEKKSDEKKSNQMVDKIREKISGFFSGDKAKERSPKLENEKLLKKELELLGLEEKLNDCENFNKLSEGAKVLALRNLKSLVLKEISSNSIKEARGKFKKTEGKREFSKFEKWRGKIKIGSEAKKIKKEKIKEISEKGLDKDKIESLENFAKGIGSYEIEFDEENNKEGFISFLKKAPGAMEEDLEDKIDEFNEISNELSEMSLGAAHDSAKKKDRKKYAELYDRYNKIKKEISSQNPSFAKKNLLRAQSQLNLVRTLKNDPVLEEEWKEASKSQNFFRKIFSNMTTKEGLSYLGSGMVLRRGASALSTTIAASASITPAIAMAGAAVGSVRGYKRAEKNIRKEDQKSLYKEKASSEERKEIRKRINEIVPEEYKKGDINEWLLSDPINNNKKEYLYLSEKLRKLDKKLKKKESKTLNILDSSSLSAKLENLIDKLDKESDPKKQEDIGRALQSRILFTEDKMAKDSIRFNDKINDPLELEDSLKRAELNLVLSDESSELCKKVQKRLNDFLDQMGVSRDKARRNYKIKQAVKGAVVAGSFAAVGSLLGSGVPEDDPTLGETPEGGEIPEGNDDINFEDDPNLGDDPGIESDSETGDDLKKESDSETGSDSSPEDESKTGDDIKEEGSSSPESLSDNEDVTDKLEEIGVSIDDLSDSQLEAIKDFDPVNLGQVEEGGSISRTLGKSIDDQSLANFIFPEGHDSLNDVPAGKYAVHVGDLCLEDADGNILVLSNEKPTLDANFINRIQELDQEVEEIIENEGSLDDLSNISEELEKAQITEKEFNIMDLDSLADMKKEEVLESVPRLDDGFDFPSEPEIDIDQVIEGEEKAFESVPRFDDSLNIPEPETDVDQVSDSLREMNQADTSVDASEEKASEEISKINLEEYFDDSGKDTGPISEDIEAEDVREGSEVDTKEKMAKSVSSKDSKVPEFLNTNDYELSTSDYRGITVESKLGDKIIFDSSNFSNIKSVEPIFDGGGGVPHYRVEFNDGGLDKFVPTELKSGETVYAKENLFSNDADSDMNSDIKGEDSSSATRENDGTKVTENFSASLTGEKLKSIEEEASKLVSKLSSFEDKESLLDYIKDVKKNFSSTGELTDFEIKSWELFYRSYENNPNSPFLEDKTRIEMKRFLGKY